MKSRGVQIILIGFILVIFGAVAPFLMVLYGLSSYFMLDILAYCSSVVGVCLGVLGAIEMRHDELKD